MALSPDMKVAALLDAHPYLLDFLVELNPHFNNLKDPQMRATMAKVATLEVAAGQAGLPVEEFIAKLQARIAREAPKA